MTARVVAWGPRLVGSAGSVGTCAADRSGFEDASVCLASEECGRVDCIVGIGPNPGISPNQVALGFTNGFGLWRAVHRESASKVRMLGRDELAGTDHGGR